MRHAALAVAVTAIALAPSCVLAEAIDRWPGIAKAYVVEIDGATRWAHEARLRLPPASLTKILTAMIVMDAASDDAIVTVTARAAAASGSRLGLRRGMQLSTGDLLAAMLLRSANDACLALAEHVAGTESAFVARMNARAKELQLDDSHFENACGFDGARHRMSARDLTRLAGLAMANARFAAIVGRDRGQARTLAGKVFDFDNTNALIGRVEGVRGVKTGWTRAAGRCLVAFADRGTAHVVLVMLGAPDRWWDAVALIETAFEEAPRK